MGSNFFSYRGYMSGVEYDEIEHLYCGELNTNDYVPYRGRTLKEAEDNFREAVDAYIASCLASGIDPDPNRHAHILVEVPECMAQREPIDLNDFIGMTNRIVRLN